MRASQNRQQFANVNHGRPANLARTEPVSYNHNMPMNNRTMNNRTGNNGLVTSSPTHTAPVTNANRPAPYNNGQRQAYNQNPNQLQGSNNNSHPQTPAYRAPNTQMNQHTQPQQMRQAPAQPQSYHPQSNMQTNQHTQPQQMQAPAPQQSHSEPSHSNGGGHDGGGHGGHGR
jgi:hypothetical protein